MFPTLARLSKASRRALTPKRGNKDFYKGLLIHLTSASGAQRVDFCRSQGQGKLSFPVDTERVLQGNMLLGDRPNIGC